ncbi:Wzz/FepE/Etk N-terminal domain-containing protein [Nocardioides sp. GY 10127]|uniref:Wzz/FepE/Etk N-terminal domain-containing protein n=1 Tax=Nocardioides sp. GY 10127 TaxID=2569762 RepID=UPI001458EA6F|nr:Wzz/FepE/Etk N-terminal domain-containing protein [Nocardioides sp. GY 10127]
MDDSHLSAPVDAGYYRRVLVRGWRLVIGGVVLGLVVGAVAFAVLPRTWTSTAAVLVTTTGATSTSSVGERTTDEEVNLDTEAQLVKSAEVVDRALTELGSDADPSTVAAQVSVQVPANTTVLEITYAADSPEAAQAGASAFAQAYLDSRRSVAEDDIDQRVQTLQDQLEQARTEQTSLQRQAAAASGADATALQAEVAAAAATVTDLAQSVASLKSILVTPGRVINEADVPDSPAQPQAALVIGSCLALGLLGGLLASAWRERSRPRLVEASDVTRETGLPVRVALPAHPAEVRTEPEFASEVTLARAWRALADDVPGTSLVVLPGDAHADAVAVGAAFSWSVARSTRPVRLVLEALAGDDLPVALDETAAATLVWDAAEPGELRTGRWTGVARGSEVHVEVVDLHGAPLSDLPTSDALTVLVAGPEGALWDTDHTEGSPTVVVVSSGADARAIQAHLPSELGADGSLMGVVLHPRPSTRATLGGVLGSTDADTLPTNADADTDADTDAATDPSAALLDEEPIEAHEEHEDVHEDAREDEAEPVAHG